MTTATPAITLQDLEISKVDGSDVNDTLITEVADMYAITFQNPPWNFTWIQFQQNPHDERSATHFVRTLVSYGSSLFCARDPGGRLVGCLMILRLTQAALDGILADLAEHSEAKPGEIYFAVFGILPEAQRQGLGERFMRLGMEWGGSESRYHLRTQEGAKGMVALSEKIAGMHVHKTRQVTQGGSTYTRRYYVKHPK